MLNALGFPLHLLATSKEKRFAETATGVAVSDQLFVLGASELYVFLTLGLTHMESGMMTNALCTR